MTSSSSHNNEVKEDIKWIKNKLNELFIGRKSRIKQFQKDLSLIILSVFIAIAATLFIEIVKMILGIYISNKIGTFSLTLLVFSFIIYALMLIIPKQIEKIAEIYDINKYKLYGEFAGISLTEKLKNVRQFCKDMKNVFSSGTLEIKFEPVLTMTSKRDIKKLTKEQKENLLFEKINSLHNLDIFLCDGEDQVVARIRIDVIRIEEKVSFFCLCECNKIGEEIANKLKKYLEKSPVIHSLGYNL